MFDPIQPKRAPVKPRTVSPISQAALPLEDAVIDWIAAHHRGVIELTGGCGAGKSTALAHLAAVLPAELPIQFFDDINRCEAEQYANEGVAIVALDPPSTWRAAPFGHVTMPLARWQEDDWIEYLLARYPRQCGSVLERIRRDRTFDRLEGNPELNSLVIDLLASQEADVPATELLRRQLTSYLVDSQNRSLTAERFDAASTFAEAVSFQYSGREVERHHRRLLESGCGTKARRLLRHKSVCHSLTTFHLLSGLERRTAEWKFEWDWPHDLFETVAAVIDTSAVTKLEKMTEGLADRNSANVVSLLVSLQPEWRPGSRLLKLKNAELSGVRWWQVDLSRADLRGARFRGADLFEANLNDAVARNADFHSARLASANLCDLKAIEANFGGACLANAIANRANFGHAEAAGADFSTADLLGSHFISTNLRAANFQSAGLDNSVFRFADVSEADFTAARLAGATLGGLDLRNCTLDGADFTTASLYNCNLEFVELAGAKFERATLSNALLTGSRMPGANFHGARLNGAGLADVDWEGADLSNADLDGATFHMGTTRSGLVDGTLASEGTWTGFYTDEYFEQSFRAPETIRKANLRGANFHGARIGGVDFYLVDLRGARYSPDQRRHFERCRAILDG